MDSLIESFRNEMFNRLVEITSTIVFSYDGIDFIYDKTFKSSDEFKSLSEEYKAKYLKVYEPYYDLDTFDLTKVTRVLKIEKNERIVGYVSFYVYEKVNAEIDFFTKEPRYNEAVEKFIKKLNKNICEQIGLSEIENIFATSHNQKSHTELFEKCLDFYSVEFYKPVENIKFDVKDKLVISKKVDGTYFDFIFDQKAFNSERLIKMDHEFFKDEQNNAGTDFKYRVPNYDVAIKIVDRNKDIDVGFIGLRMFNKGIVTVSVYIENKYRGLGLYSYFLKHFNLFTRLFKQEINWLSIYVYTKNKTSMSVHNKLLGEAKIKTFHKRV